ncbi:MAG: hypothetical protein KAW16_06015 [candidate division Zixibacteria bacterium]|nr:hypothetical protein [candidate division Zixibacteria bacterium]
MHTHRGRGKSFVLVGNGHLVLPPPFMVSEVEPLAGDQDKSVTIIATD